MKPFKLVSILLVVLAVLLSGCHDEDDFGYAPDFDDPAAVFLDVPFYQQQTQVWCWAAVIEMISSYYGRRAYQCQTLQYWYSFDCCNFPQYCVTTGSELQIQQSFAALGIQSSMYFSPLNWANFVTEIDNGRPIIIFYRNSFSGHVVVGFGYNSEYQTIFVNDPYYGVFEVPFGTSFVYNGSSLWQETLAGIAPI